MSVENGPNGPSPLRLLLSHDALVANWQWLAQRSGAAACGAAVKANGYGLGGVDVARRLQSAGCADFFVATWAEAQAIAPAISGAGLSVLHGPFAEDMPMAMTGIARPVINSVVQAQRWRAAGGGPCDAMVDTG
ncbi:MAG: alanine racemase, partial [Sphingopyxis sp.]